MALDFDPSRVPSTPDEIRLSAALQPVAHLYAGLDESGYPSPMLAEKRDREVAALCRQADSMRGLWPLVVGVAIGAAGMAAVMLWVTRP